jgi:hypothetical protein
MMHLFDKIENIEVVLIQSIHQSLPGMGVRKFVNPIPGAMR